MKKKKEHFVLGLDGGGTRTVAGLSDLEGNILRMAQVGPSKPRNIGKKKALENITKAIRRVLRKEKILSAFISIGGADEVDGFKKEVKLQVLKILGKGVKVKIANDHIAAFHSGGSKEGVLVISGTGCGVHAWKKEDYASAGGFGWLGDEGSAFWIGQRVYQSVLKAIDGRGPKTVLVKMLTDCLGVRNGKGFDFKKRLTEKVYSSDVMKIIPFFSILCDKAAQKKDRVAMEIMRQAGFELALSAQTVIKKLRFKKQEFPLILVGGVFNSVLVLRTFKKEIKSFAPKADIVFVEDPVIGAIKLALDAVGQ